MQFRHIILAAIALLALASPLYSQEATPIRSSPWLLRRYSATEGISQSDVRFLIERGYVPVGLEIEQGAEIAMLFRTADLPTAGWTITNHPDLSALESEFAEVLRQGFLPMDISAQGDSLSVLWIAANTRIEGWRVHATPRSTTALSNALSSFEDQGFSLWGVSDDGSRIWYLFVDWADDVSQEGLLTFTASDSSSIEDTFATAESSGWIPNGIGISGNDYLFAFGR